MRLAIYVIAIEAIQNIRIHNFSIPEIQRKSLIELNLKLYDFWSINMRHKSKCTVSVK